MGQTTNDWEVVERALHFSSEKFDKAALAALARLKSAFETESAGGKRAIAELLKADAEIARLKDYSQEAEAHFERDRKILTDSLKAGWDQQREFRAEIERLEADAQRQRELIAECATYIQASLRHCNVEGGLSLLRRLAAHRIIRAALSGKERG